MDLPAGRTHAVTGVINNVFIPVNYTNYCICDREYALFFETLDNVLYVYANRMDFISVKYDIIESQKELQSLMNKYLSDDIRVSERLSIYEMNLPSRKMVVFIPGRSRFEITPYSNMGKRIISCGSAYLHEDLSKGLSKADVDAATCINAKWKILKIENKWYNWTYINNSVVITSEYEPNWFTDEDGINKFVMSEVDRFGNIICTLFADKGKSKDVKIPRYYHANNPDFKLNETVARMAPSSTFVIMTGRQGMKK